MFPAVFLIPSHHMMVPGMVGPRWSRLGADPSSGTAGHRCGITVRVTEQSCAWQYKFQDFVTWQVGRAGAGSGPPAPPPLDLAAPAPLRRAVRHRLPGLPRRAELRPRG